MFVTASLLEPECVGKRLSSARQSYILKNSLQDGQKDSCQKPQKPNQN